MMITVLGPTATGKTKLAAALSYLYDGEIISADSRQVYKGMDIGTGKDLEDYYIHDTLIPYHLIDIAEPGQEYNVYAFQQDFVSAYNKIMDRGKTPVLCGGSGLYLESVLQGYRLLEVPENLSFRQKLLQKTDEELREMLHTMRPGMHNTSDLTERSRLVRALEIETYYAENPATPHDFPRVNPVIIGIHFERAELRKRITERLKARLKEGMTEEVQYLLTTGLTAEQLKFYGLEYRFVTGYVTGEMEYGDMFSKLNTAIHQFAKRQVTWFRRMEKRGIKIHWINGALPMPDKLSEAEEIIKTLSENTA